MKVSGRRNCFNWSSIAQIIGWIGIFSSIGLIVLCGPLTLIYDSFAYIVAFMAMCGLFCFQYAIFFTIHSIIVAFYSTLSLCNYSNKFNHMHQLADGRFKSE